MSKSQNANQPAAYGSLASQAFIGDYRIITPNPAPARQARTSWGTAVPAGNTQPSQQQKPSTEKK